MVYQNPVRKWINLWSIVCLGMSTISLVWCFKLTIHGLMMSDGAMEFFQDVVRMLLQHKCPIEATWRKWGCCPRPLWWLYQWGLNGWLHGSFRTLTWDNMRTYINQLAEDVEGDHWDHHKLFCDGCLIHPIGPIGFISCVGIGIDIITQDAQDPQHYTPPYDAFAFYFVGMCVVCFI